MPGKKMLIGKKIRHYAVKFIMEAILIAICVVLSLTAPNFLKSENLMNILYAVSMQGLIAFGMTMVIIAGEIDLSVGTVVAFSGCLAAYLVKAGMPVPLAMLATVAVGFGLGSFTGMMRTRFQVPSFITTLALFTGLRGMALMLANGFTIIPNFPQWYLDIGSGRVFGIPVPAIIFVAGFLFVQFLMNYTSFGRSVYAVGGNAAAARLCGIRVPMVRMLALATTAAFAAMSGIMLSARMASGMPNAATGWELDVIAAVIIGGTSFAGGVGTVWGTMIGVIFIGVIVNGMTMLNVETYMQFIVRGLLILFAVLMNRVQERNTSTA